MPQDITFATSAAPLDLTILLFNLTIGVVLGILLRWHFRRFGSTLSNRDEFAQVFPFILLTTILIITVVKSSLALSLGLVGALSIVRFRTPIKEPEELAYLFIAIAMGLGLGANQTLPTVVAGLFILSAIAALSSFRKGSNGKNIFISIDWHGKKDEHPDQFIEQINVIIGKHSVNSDLRRFDVHENSIEATYFIDILSSDNLSAMTNDLRQYCPVIGITFLDQNQLPSL
ncbi:MAG: DUF4956 domain-containing protein [Desulfobacula sp.]|jgi:hypothetical protein|nr:DUF4956 domain-containing protein [Desulfobacula sp.]